MVRSGAWTILIALASCARSHAVDSDVSSESFEPADAGGSAACAEQLVSVEDGAPADLACTGLFANVAKGTLGRDVESFEPAFALWSDDAGKSRWIKLPRGAKIDTSNPRRWRFPVHTKLWKEFRANGARVETRFYQKVEDDWWVKATYLWNDEGTHAIRHDGSVQLTRNGVDYEVPGSDTCNDCHDGSPDNVMGFEAVSLGLPGAETGGLTLERLVAEDRLTDPPDRTEYTIGDDGTGKAAEALGWLHINCGVACHNDGVNSEAETTGLRMKLDPAELDGRPASELEALKLLVDVPAMTSQWQGKKRIVPGKPEESLLYQLITTRVGTSSNKQMPPLATRIVDERNAATIREWILAMPPRAESSGEP